MLCGNYLELEGNTQKAVGGGRHGRGCGARRGECDGVLMVSTLPKQCPSETLSSARRIPATRLARQSARRPRTPCCSRPNHWLCMYMAETLYDKYTRYIYRLDPCAPSEKNSHHHRRINRPRSHPTQPPAEHTADPTCTASQPPLHAALAAQSSPLVLPSIPFRSPHSQSPDSPRTAADTLPTDPPHMAGMARTS